MAFRKAEIRLHTLICLVAVASFWIVSSAGIRITLTPPELQSKKTGDTFAVNCQLDDVNSNEQSAVSPQWVKVIGPGHEEQVPASGNVYVRPKEDEKSVMLLFNEATLNDAGEYKCISGDHHSSIMVKVHRSISFTDTPKEQHPVDGTDATIVCKVDAEPKPIVFWSRGEDESLTINGGRYTVSEGNLKIPNFKREADDGTYQCEAIQEITGDRKVLSISVVGYVPPGNVHMVLSDNEKWPQGVHEDATNVKITCSSTGVPSPVYKWTKDGTELHDDGHFTMPRPGVLEIASINVNDDGLYKCVAANDVGQSEGEITLTIFKKATIVAVSGQEQAKADDDVSFVCEYDGTEQVEAIWINAGNVIPVKEEPDAETESSPKTNEKYVVKEDKKITLHLKGITLADAGEYQCRVSNEAGTATKSLNLDVQRSPLIVSSTLGKVRAIVNSEYSLFCEAYGVPPATISWWKGSTHLTSEDYDNVEIISTLGGDQNHVVSTLKITVTSEEDFGEYTCKADSSVPPEATKSIEVIKVEPPMHPNLQCSESDSKPTIISLMIDTFSSSQEERYWPTTLDVIVIRRDDFAYQTTAVLNFAPSGQYNIPNLDPSTMYVFNVTGKNEAGSSTSAVVDCETPAPSPPGRPVIPATIRCNSTAQCLVSWILEHTGGKSVDMYKMEYGPMGPDGERENPKNVTINEQSYVFLNLVPRTNYQVRLWAHNAEGWSEAAVANMTTPDETLAESGDSYSTEEGASAGAIVGTVIIIVLLIVVLVDVACYYVNQCGVLMTICVNFCGKTPPQGKSKRTVVEGGVGKENRMEEGYAEKEPVKEEQLAVVSERGDVDGASESTPMMGQNGREKRKDTAV